MTRGLLISGMFRSGTTLLSRIISAHPHALAISDPFVYFYKVLRSSVTAAAGLAVDAAAPSSTWFDDDQAHAMRALLDGSLNRPIAARELDRLRILVREWKSEQHPDLAARLNELRGNTFAEVLESFLALCGSVYSGGKNLVLLGTKLSWSEEFIGATARSFPDMRFIIPVRDPRAIAASQNSQTGHEKGKRPLLFYVRHWRKSVAFALLWSEILSEFKDRVTIVRYEDLVQDPARTIPRVAAFLSLDFRPAMMDARGFSEDAGRVAWTPNSSYGDKDARPRKIYTTSLNQWQNILSPEEIAFIETLAAPEMRLMGYALTQQPVSDERMLAGTPEPPFDELSEWLKPFPEAAYLRDPGLMRREITLERERLTALANPATLNPKRLEDLFITREIFELLRG